MAAGGGTSAHLLTTQGFNFTAFLLLAAWFQCKHSQGKCARTQPGTGWKLHQKEKLTDVVSDRGLGSHTHLSPLGLRSIHPKKRLSFWCNELQRYTRESEKRKTHGGSCAPCYFCRLVLIQFAIETWIHQLVTLWFVHWEREAERGTLTQALTSMTWTGEGEQQGQEGSRQDRVQGSHVFELKVKSFTLTLKTLHSEGTEWVSSFRTCYKILLYVKGQGWGGPTRGTSCSTPHPHRHTQNHILPHSCTYTLTSARTCECIIHVCVCVCVVSGPQQKIEHTHSNTSSYALSVSLWPLLDSQPPSSFCLAQ